jgi:hypothetical protein
MKLKELATQPKLIKVSIDDETLLEKYGEAVDFWMYDRMPLDRYTKLAGIKTDDFTSMIDLVKEIVLDEDGVPVMDEKHVLPTDLLNAAMVKVVDIVGK